MKVLDQVKQGIKNSKAYSLIRNNKFLMKFGKKKKVTNIYQASQWQMIWMKRFSLLMPRGNDARVREVVAIEYLERRLHGLGPR